MLGRRRKKQSEEELLITSLTFTGMLVGSGAAREVRSFHVYVEGVSQDEKVLNWIEHLSTLTPYAFAKVLTRLGENTLIGAALALVVHRYCMAWLSGEAFGYDATDFVRAAFEGEFEDPDDPTHRAVQHILQLTPPLVSQLEGPEEAELVLALLREDGETFSRLKAVDFPGGVPPLEAEAQLSVYVPLTLFTHLHKMCVQLSSRFGFPPNSYVDRSAAACMVVADSYLEFDDELDSPDPLVQAQIAGKYADLVSQVLGSHDPVATAIQLTDDDGIG